ncbi:hypothetical protein [Microcoleus sp. Pol12A6]|uniref:hypothetical protein n=1 Tax=Microcoleus sp. Pol12A6 TaxID=3055393 RepID=UPI002FD31AE1
MRELFVGIGIRHARLRKRGFDIIPAQRESILVISRCRVVDNSQFCIFHSQLPIPHS